MNRKQRRSQQRAHRSNTHRSNSVKILPVKNQTKDVEVMMTTLRSFCYILNRDLGLGQKRLSRCLQAYNDFWICEEKDNPTVYDDLCRWAMHIGLDELQ